MDRPSHSGGVPLVEGWQPRTHYPNLARAATRFRLKLRPPRARWRRVEEVRRTHVVVVVVVVVIVVVQHVRKKDLKPDYEITLQRTNT